MHMGIEKLPEWRINRNRLRGRSGFSRTGSARDVLHCAKPLRSGIYVTYGLDEQELRVIKTIKTAHRILLLSVTNTTGSGTPGVRQ